MSEPSNMALTTGDRKSTPWQCTSGTGLVVIALALMALATTRAEITGAIWMWATLGMLITGSVLYAYGTFVVKQVGEPNNGTWFAPLTSRGTWAWVFGAMLTLFYVLLYWYPEMLGLGEQTNTGLVALFDPLAMLFHGSGAKASQWFMYGTLYTVLILTLGIRFIFKYRRNRYQVIRTIVLMAAQTCLAYLVPEILEGLQDGKAYFAKDIKYFWPLNYYFFEDWHLDAMRQGGTLGMVCLVWGIIGFALLTPVLTYFLGKRWYCSWICGCGGLAETAGDSFRHLSSKSIRAWKLERWLIHGVLVYIVVVTAVVLYGYFSGSGSIAGVDIYTWFRRPYGFLIGSMFSGVIGVGFYPLLGSRVWCRFGCPMAAYMGLFQRRLSKYRITVNSGQCISCGQCSTYCEQGIDVRWYAMRGQDVVRASCVGCGICSTVCPRGVLKLENGPMETLQREART
ncbi:MAG: 4Fe-4S binding protein [Flavobacteriales bacterium]|nr:4Fe-4S binding protein [Flavobacteriales bacterium]MCB9448154.1 4Fe-4S binding protein [Flavobacteriales bacterium]